MGQPVFRVFGMEAREREGEGEGRGTGDLGCLFTAQSLIGNK